METLRDNLKSKGVTVSLCNLDPLETSPANPDPGYYLLKMRENIDNLAKVMK